MKFCTVKLTLFCAFAFLELSFTNGETFDEDEFRPAYDVSQSLANAIPNFRTIQNGDVLTEYLNKEVLDYIIKVLSHPTDLISAFTNLTEKCVGDLNYTAEHLTFQDLKNKSWAVRMIDAVAKPESGVLVGNVKWLGDFEECTGVYAPKKDNSSVGGFHGKYCKLQMPGLMIIQPTLGFCIPETCRLPEKFEIDLSFLNATLGLDKYNATISCIPVNKELTDGAITTIFIISVFVFMVLLGSSVTVIKHFSSGKRRRNSCCSSENGKAGVVNHDSEHSIHDSDDQIIITEGSKTRFSNFIEKVDPFLNCFCIFTNGSKLLNTDATEGQLLCLHGIRFLSMSWVIIGHVYISFSDAIRSFYGILDKIDNFPFQVILNGFFSVDSFFVLSGFLMSYLYFQEASKNKGKTPWLYFYIHRYLRLTPVYMVVLAFFTTLSPYLSSGPLSAIYDTEPICQKTWWWNLLYINNFKDSIEMCMGWSWYLANDMQFFAVSPLFLITLWRWPKIGYSILALFLCGVWAVSFYLTYHFDLVAGGMGNVVQLTKNDMSFATRWQFTFDKTYTKPYTRMGPYLVGIALGHFMFKKKITNYKPDFKTLLIGWSITIPVGLSCVYGLYKSNPDLIAASFYNSLTRTAFALCLGWVIFTCLTGTGGAVDKILSFKLFIPLSRLTYCAYLIHLIIVMYYAQSLKTTMNFSHPTMVTLFLGLMVIVYAFSFLVSLVFESPLIRLEKFVRNKFKS